MRVRAGIAILGFVSRVFSACSSASDASQDPVRGAGSSLQPVRVDDGRIRSACALNGESGVDPGEQRRAQIIVFQKVTEPANPGLIRRRFAPEVDADEAPRRLDVVQHFFQRPVRQVVPVAQAAHLQHTLKPIPLLSALGRGTVGSDHGIESLPRYDSVHFSQEPLTPPHLAVAFESRLGEALLSHG